MDIDLISSTTITCIHIAHDLSLNLTISTTHGVSSRGGGSVCDPWHEGNIVRSEFGLWSHSPQIPFIAFWVYTTTTTTTTVDHRKQSREDKSN
jgi:hypothetical protein